MLRGESRFYLDYFSKIILINQVQNARVPKYCVFTYPSLQIGVIMLKYFQLYTYKAVPSRRQNGDLYATRKSQH